MEVISCTSKLIDCTYLLLREVDIVWGYDLRLYAYKLPDATSSVWMVFGNGEPKFPKFALLRQNRHLVQET